MNPARRPVSIVAERAVRYLRDADRPVDSTRLARDLLHTAAPDEPTARAVLETAFRGDERLRYTPEGWVAERDEREEPDAAAADPPRVLFVLEGGRPRGRNEFVLRHVVAVRVEGDEVVAACGGEVRPGPIGDSLRTRLLELLHDAVPVVHDPPGGLGAVERWLGAPLGSPVSLRRLAHDRLGLPARHHFESLAAKLGLGWRETDDRLDLAEVTDACLDRLRREGESLHDLQEACAGGGSVVDWSRVGFDPATLRAIPSTPGTYRFFDRNGKLLYVGKSKNLNRRVASYFRHDARRSPRQVEMLSRLYRVEVEPTGSDLEAVLREATAIRRRAPSANVQREIRPRAREDARLASILILEPGTGPVVLRAYLLRDGRLLDKVPIGPRGGGLRRVRRVLEDRYFGLPDGPTPAEGTDVDVECIVRWLTANRDRVVAFDPTDLRSADEVIDRLRWFLAHGGPFEPDGSPIRTL